MAYHTYADGVVLDRVTMRGMPARSATIIDAMTGDQVQAYSMGEDPAPFTLATNAWGYFPQFQTLDVHAHIRLTFGKLTLSRIAFETVTDALAAALGAEQSALQAAADAALAAGLVNAPADTAIGVLLDSGTSTTRIKLDARYATKAVATTAVAGLMSAADKTKLDGAPSSAVATSVANGLMPAADKAKLDNAVSTATASRLMIRDAAGRVAVATPSATGDAATKGYVDGRTPTATAAVAGLMPAADKAKLDAATASLVNDTLVRRHATTGVFSIAEPTADTHPVTKLYADTLKAVKTLPSTAHNLDDYTTTDEYRQGLSASATMAGNYPVNMAGNLTVVAQGNMVFQVYQTYGTSAGGGNQLFWRGSYNGVFQPWQEAQRGPDLITPLVSPIVIAHRGGALVHPEHSMEGYLDSMNSGFLPEVDIQFLADSTPVAIHDSTVTRTMTGVTGSVSALTLAQWKAGMIKNPITGGKTARALTWEEILDQIGGKVCIVAEIKSGATGAQINECLKLAAVRGLRRAVLFQTFDRAAVDQIQAAGFACVYLFGSMPAETPAAMFAAGIRWVGPAVAVGNTNMTALNTAGLKVLPYGITTRAAVTALPSTVAGYFSDDPWMNAGQLQADAAPRWSKGEAWPAGDAYGNSVVGGPIVSMRSLLAIEGGSLHVSHDGSDAPRNCHIDLSHMTGGPIDRPCVLTLEAYFLRRAITQGTNIGFTLFRNTSDPEATFEDKAKTGQNGFTFAIRRTGELNGWHYTNGAAAVSLGAGVTSPTEVAAAGVMGKVTLRLEMSTGWMGLTHVESGRIFTATNTMVGPFKPMLRIFAGEVLFTHVSIAPYDA